MNINKTKALEKNILLFYFIEIIFFLISIFLNNNPHHMVTNQNKCITYVDVGIKQKEITRSKKKENKNKEKQTFFFCITSKNIFE